MFDVRFRGVIYFLVLYDRWPWSFSDRINMSILFISRIFMSVIRLTSLIWCSSFCVLSVTSSLLKLYFKKIHLFFQGFIKLIVFFTLSLHVINLIPILCYFQHVCKLLHINCNNRRNFLFLFRRNVDKIFISWRLSIFVGHGFH